MSSENVVIGASLLGTGALLYAVCVPLLYDRIKPNHYYGIRLPKSFESQENWFKMNRYGARQMMKWSLVMAACGVLAMLLPLRGNTPLTLVFAVLPTLLMLVPVIQIVRYSKTL